MLVVEDLALILRINIIHDIPIETRVFKPFSESEFEICETWRWKKRLQFYPLGFRRWQDGR